MLIAQTETVFINENIFIGLSGLTKRVVMFCKY